MPFRVVVPVYNPQTERHLLELAALITQEQRGEIVPLAIAEAKARLDSPQLDLDVARCRKLLAQAQKIAQELNVIAQPKLRVEYDVAHGICHASREVDASKIILGFNDHDLDNFHSFLFGSIINRVLWSAHCPVVVARLWESPLQIRRILIPIESLTPIGLRPVRFAQALVNKPEMEVTLLHVCPFGTDKEGKTQLHQQLEIIANQYLPQATVDIRITAQNNFVKETLDASQTHQLVILRSQRQRVGVDNLALGTNTTPLIQNLNCSIVLLGEL